MWLPVAGVHSIERVRVTVNLRQSLATKIVRDFGKEIDPIRQELGFDPLISTGTQMLSFQAGPEGFVSLPPQEGNVGSGWELRRNPAPGRTVELFALSSQPVAAPNQPATSLVYETGEYSRWPIFQDRFAVVTQRILPRFVELGDVQSVILEYTDRFLSVPIGEKSRPGELLNLLEGVLPPSVVEDGEFFHIHRGWFEPAAFGRLLINLNFDGQDVEVAPGQVQRTVQILTRAEGRAGIWNTDGPSIDHQLTVMHEQTGRVFREALVPAISEQIGLV